MLLTITVLGNDCFEYIPSKSFNVVTINGEQLDDMLMNLPDNVSVEFEDNTNFKPVILSMTVNQYSFVG